MRSLRANAERIHSSVLDSSEITLQHQHHLLIRAAVQGPLEGAMAETHGRVHIDKVAAVTRAAKVEAFNRGRVQDDADVERLDRQFVGSCSPSW
jgi:hypothetical protein